MKDFLKSILATTLAILLLLGAVEETRAGSMVNGMKIMKRLMKAGIMMHMGSKKIPRILPVPVPIPIRTDQEYNFAGGHFGNDYYAAQGSGFVPRYGPGRYNHLVGGRYGNGMYGGGGYGSYAAESAWW